jgi:hypothetical protein
MQNKSARPMTENLTSDRNATRTVRSRQAVNTF